MTLLNCNLSLSLSLSLSLKAFCFCQVNKKSALIQDLERKQTEKPDPFSAVIVLIYSSVFFCFHKPLRLNSWSLSQIIVHGKGRHFVFGKSKPENKNHNHSTRWNRKWKSYFIHCYTLQDMCELMQPTTNLIVKLFLNL